MTSIQDNIAIDYYRNSNADDKVGKERTELFQSIDCCVDRVPEERITDR